MGVGVELVTTAEPPMSDLTAVGVELPGAVNHATGHPTSRLLMPGWETVDVPAQLGGDAPATMTDDRHHLRVGTAAERGWPGPTLHQVARP